MKWIDYLNFVGSLASITALALVVFEDMNWMKGFIILVSAIFAFCITTVFAKLSYSVYNRWDAGKDNLIKIPSLIIGGFVCIIILAYVFWVAFCIFECIVELLSALLKAIDI